MNILNEKIITTNDEIANEYYGFVYITKHISKDKYYIGKKNFNRNWKGYLGSGKYLKRAIRKYGKSDFKRYIVAVTHSEEESCEIERKLIDKYKATVSDKFYNIHEGGEGGYTLAGYSELQKEEYRHKMRVVIKNKIKTDASYLQRVSAGVRKAKGTSEYKEKSSKAQKRRYEKIEERLKTGLASKKVWDSLSEEQKANRVQGLIEHTNNPETKKQLSERWSGSNNPKFGTIMSEETKQMLADARREKCSRSIYMYDENWVLVEKFPTRAKAKEFLNTKGHTQLLHHMRNGTLYRGYYWSDKLLNGSQTTIESISKEKDFRE